VCFGVNDGFVALVFVGGGGGLNFGFDVSEKRKISYWCRNTSDASHLSNGSLVTLSTARLCCYEEHQQVLPALHGET